MNSIEGLNERQIEAVKTFDQNLMIFAGPGTGKTRVITRKIAFLFENGNVPAHRKVLAITFTNKAANEMKKRLKEFPISARQLFVSNFHKFCAFVLISYGDYIGINRQFTFATRNQQLTLAKSVLKDLEFHAMKPYDFLNAISRLKNEAKHWDGFISNVPSLVKQFKPATIEYHSRLHQANMIDFDDAILLTITLFQDHPEILSLFHNAYPFILIDEMQDTNPIQLELIKLLSQNVQHVTAVADDDQSIYKWRGALSGVISDYVEALNAAEIVLNENYRSPQMVLDAANALVKNIEQRVRKKLIGRANEVDDLVEKHEFSTWLDEADWIAGKIKELHKTQGIQYKEMIILYRNRQPSLHSIDDALKELNIPYSHFGKSFNTQDYLLADQIINVIKLIHQPENRVILSDLLTSLSQRFGDETMFSEYSGDTDVARIASTEPRDSFLYKLAQLILTWDKKRAYQELYYEIFNQLNIEGALSHLDEKRREEEKKHLDLLLGRVMQNLRMSFHELLADLDLRNDDDHIEQAQNCVGISTLHTVKGLEYKVVFVIALEEFSIPGRNRGTHLEDEERRLLYVGMTRSESKLYLSFANNRVDWYGNKRKQQPSHFLKDIPVPLIIH